MDCGPGLSGLNHVDMGVDMLINLSTINHFLLFYLFISSYHWDLYIHRLPYNNFNEK